MTTATVTDLSVRYGPTVAVDRLSLSAGGGEILALLGGDGAGKTSVLRALAGAVAPAAGEVIRPEASEIGYMPGANGVYPDLTVAENLRFAGSAYGLRRERLAERVDGLLETTDLTEARDRLTGALSGGMRQKLALACALVHRPRLLILDEPTTGIDPVSRAELWRGIAAAAAAGAAVVFSSTYVDEADRAGFVVVLDGGRTLVEGTPDEIISSMPGRLSQTDRRPASELSYRRGAHFRVWHPSDGRHRSDVVPDLQDAIIVAALRARAGRTP